MTWTHVRFAGPVPRGCYPGIDFGGAGRTRTDDTNGLQGLGVATCQPRNATTPPFPGAAFVFQGAVSTASVGRMSSFA